MPIIGGLVGVPLHPRSRRTISINHPTQVRRAFRRFDERGVPQPGVIDPRGVDHFDAGDPREGVIGLPACHPP